MKNQVLHTVWCNISGETAGEIWTWSLLGVKGLRVGCLAVMNRGFINCEHSHKSHGVAPVTCICGVNKRITQSLHGMHWGASLWVVDFGDFQGGYTKGIFCARKNACHYQLKCRKELWLQGREKLWSNCKRMGLLKELRQSYNDYEQKRSMLGLSGVRDSVCNHTSDREIGRPWRGSQIYYHKYDYRPTSGDAKSHYQLIISITILKDYLSRMWLRDLNSAQCFWLAQPTVRLQLSDYIQVSN